MTFDSSGNEPTLLELMQDPIMRILRLYDGLPPLDWSEWFDQSDMDEVELAAA